MFEKVLMPTDGSAVSLGAAGRAVALARIAGGALLVVYVQKPYPYAGVGATSKVGFDEHQAAGHRIAAEAFDRVRALAAAQGVALETHVVEGSDAAESIVETARSSGADTIVMASRGHTGVSRLLLGSVALKVLELAPVAVLIVK